MFKSFSMELAGRTLTVEVGRVAKQANGSLPKIIIFVYGEP